ncbi:pilus assembly protein TadG-related protein [Halomonas dongshanensis]|uniref:Pilus assembly protein TadG-related protein n=1 Tax=Halomonas dongshanensis TaxID=2890835 RepID=A0ABT2EGT4_9GAMM|nr:pilus assembly protein TadG-related protein [Halomonas dongshanensis]MCS2610793.1 pilus assembly protein TadG-related protein [Halomonas dongshanensis]
MATASFTSFSGSARQRGVVSILTAFLLVMMLALLALVVDTGRLYLEQRNLQKIADMAALDASARLPRGNCGDNPSMAAAFATESARLHGFNADVITRCATVATNEEGLRTVTETPSGTAVSVTVSESHPASIVLRGGALFSDGFEGNVNLQATASAQRNSESVTTFSVGSQLLNLSENALVGKLLEGVGINPSRLTVLDSDGLLNAKVTPAGLLQALGVEISVNELALLTPQGLLERIETDIGAIGFDRLITASLELISDSAVAAEIGVVRAEILSSDIRNANINLLGEGGLLSVGAGNDGTVRPALESELSLGNLLSGAILAGTRGHAVAVDSLSLLGIDVEASVTEPPAWATGPVGTTAYSGQVRAHIDIDTNDIPLIGPVLRLLLGLRIHLPITVDLASARGELMATQCSSSQSTADIEVTSSVLNVCIGEIDEGDLWSGTESCSAYVRNTELISLFGESILSGKSVIPALESTERLNGMQVGETRFTQPNQLALGNTVDNITAGLLDLLAGLFRPTVRDHGGGLESNINRDRQIEYLAEYYLEQTKSSNGRYDVNAVATLILNGNGELSPLTRNWTFDRAIPTTGLLGLYVRPSANWTRGSFLDAFRAYTSTPYSILDAVGIPTFDNGYQSCAGLLSSLLNWNGCVKHNLTKLLKSSPDIENSTAFQSVGQLITNPNTNTVACSGGLCSILRPVLNLLKPALNGVGGVLTTLLADTLGAQAGRSEVYVDAVSCGVPTLVGNASE